MYMYYNAHPKGLLVQDCVKRAISRAAEMDYHQVQLELNRYKKVTGAKQYNTDYNPHKYVENVLKGVKLSFPAVKGKPRMNGRRFCECYPTGNYILNMAGHWSCCVDGVIYDTWDCSEKCVYTAYKVKDSTPKRAISVVQDESSKSTHNITYNNKDDLVAQLRKDFELFIKHHISNGSTNVRFTIEV